MPGFVLRSASWRIDGRRPRVRVAVAVTDDAVGRIQQVAAACRALGFEHHSTLYGVGVLTGFVAADGLAVLRRVSGVLAVETERAVLPRARCA